MGLGFDKYQGAGNDFLVVEADAEGAVSPELAARLCDRRFGVGGDGVLLVLPPAGSRALARMRVLNADGSVPEMCGNGLRCVAVHLAQKHGKAEFTVETDAGEKLCVVTNGDGASRASRVRIDMGKVIVGEPITLDAGGERHTFVRASVGNPHAITFEPIPRDRMSVIGPAVEKNPVFEGGTNVEFARLDGDTIDLVVWERGVGITHACGTGACATVAVAVARGLVAAGRALDVRLPGGTLRVTIAADGRATLEGDAVHVFSGRTTEHAR
jgi:diaminopimelate epimerase